MASGETLLVFTPLSNEPPAASFATLDLRNSHPVLDFDGAADEEAVFTAILPRRYSGGGLTVKLHIAFTTAVAGTSRWQTAFERMLAGTLDIDADSFAAFNSGPAAAPGTSGVLVIASIAHLAGAEMDGLAVGDAFRLKVRRDADGTSGTDDIATDAELVAVEIMET